MLIVHHRINDSQKLTSVPFEHGIEIDIRSDKQGLYLAHDPFESGERFDEFLRNYKHKLLIVNVKEEGLEFEVERLLASHRITSYFFLDQSLPFVVRRGLAGHRDSSARLSEFESLDSVRLISRFCRWVWVDFFNTPQVNSVGFNELRELGHKICLVSPELHGAWRETEAVALSKEIKALGLEVDAVCTKLPNLWNPTLE